MDMLLLGETITAPGGTAVNYYGFWMPAQGNEGVAGCEVFYSANQPFTLNMETKSSDQADSSATVIGGVGATLTSGVPGTYKFDVNNAMDLVRYRLTSSAAGAATIHLQFAQPLWQPN